MTGAEGIDAMKRLKSAIPKACEGVLGIIPYSIGYISYKHNAPYTGIYGRPLRMPSEWRLSANPTIAERLLARHG